jgi:Fe-S-cluster containining protein
LLPRSGKGINIQTHRLVIDKTQTTQKITHPTILLLCTFISMECVCLAPRGRIHLSEPMPCRTRRDTYTGMQTDRSEFMKYAIEMSPVAMIYIQNLIKTSLGIQKLIWWDKERMETA